MPRKIVLNINELPHCCDAAFDNAHHVGAIDPFWRTMSVRSRFEEARDVRRGDGLG